jgi:hypothetical protein
MTEDHELDLRRSHLGLGLELGLEEASPAHASARHAGIDETPAAGSLRLGDHVPGSLHMHRVKPPVLTLVSHPYQVNHHVAAFGSPEYRVGPGHVSLPPFDWKRGRSPGRPACKTAYPVSLRQQPGDQMSSDEARCPCHEHAPGWRHGL